MQFTPKSVLAACAVVLVGALGLAAPAAAGPYADASTAYVRGEYATALRLWRPLADQGLNGAQYGLGLMYDKGRGVPQNFVYAHMWFDLSAAQGNLSALTSRDMAARRMSAAQVAEAQKLAREWHEEKKK